MRKTKRSHFWTASRICASNDSPGGRDERSRNTLCPSSLSDNSTRVAASACSEEYERKIVLIDRQRSLAREERDQLLGLVGRIDELAAPALRLAAVGEHRRPAMPHLQVDDDQPLSRTVDAPAADERARRRNEISGSDEQPEAAFADVHDLSFERHSRARGDRAIQRQVGRNLLSRVRAPLTAHRDLG